MPRDDDESKIPQLGTVPPPPGESDAYNAPTKVGPMAAQIAELINAATEEAQRKLGVAESMPSGRPTGAPPRNYEEDAAFDDATRVGDGAYAIATEEGVSTAPPPVPVPTTPPPAEPEPEEAAPPPADTERETEPEPEDTPASEPMNYSDPIAHTRPEWSSVSRSEPKIPAAAPPSRMPLLVGIMVVLFALLGIAFLVYGHRR